MLLKDLTTNIYLYIYKYCNNRNLASVHIYIYDKYILYYIYIIINIIYYICIYIYIIYIHYIYIVLAKTLRTDSNK